MRFAFGYHVFSFLIWQKLGRLNKLKIEFEKDVLIQAITEKCDTPQANHANT